MWAIAWAPLRGQKNHRSTVCFDVVVLCASSFLYWDLKYREYYYYFCSHLEPNGHKPFKAPVLKLLTLLGQSFSTLVDITLGNLIKVINKNYFMHRSWISWNIEKFSKCIGNGYKKKCFLGGHSLKTENSHDINIVVTGVIAGRHFDNMWCRQRRWIIEYDNLYHHNHDEIIRFLFRKCSYGWRRLRVRTVWIWPSIN